MSRARYHDPNLAQAPFENTRPIERLSLALWVLALVVGAAAFWLVAGARRDAGSRQAELANLNAEVANLRSRTTSLRAGLEKAALGERNQRTEFLNQRIAERAFSWNDLFDVLGEVLPRGVRVQSLTPQGFGAKTMKGTKQDAASPATSLVQMQIAGEAEEGEALLEFVDRLYVHPAFGDPNLARESTGKDNHVDFDLTVAYVPGWRAARELERAAASAVDAPAAGAARPTGVVAKNPVTGESSAGETPGAGARPAPEAPVASPSVTVTETSKKESAPAGRALSTARPPIPAGGTFVREPKERAVVEPERTAVDPGAARDRAAREGSSAPTAFALPAPLRPYASAPGGGR